MLTGRRCAIVTLKRTVLTLLSSLSSPSVSMRGTIISLADVKIGMLPLRVSVRKSRLGAIGSSDFCYIRRKAVRWRFFLPAF